MARAAAAVILGCSLFGAQALAKDTKDSDEGSGRSVWRSRGSLLDASVQERRPMLSGFVGLPYGYYGYGAIGFPIGVGISYLQPILAQGFVPPWNDSFSLEFGGNAAFTFPNGNFTTYVSIPVEAVWALHLTPRFTAYAKAGAALDLTFGYWATRRGIAVGAYPVAGVGLWLRIGQRLVFRAEATYPWLKVGLGFEL